MCLFFCGVSLILGIIIGHGSFNARKSNRFILDYDWVRSAGAEEIKRLKLPQSDSVDAIIKKILFERAEKAILDFDVIEYNGVYSFNKVRRNATDYYHLRVKE